MLEILSESGIEDVATVFCARFRRDDRYAIELVDGLETGIPREQKWIVNVSTQFGCPVGCSFCDAGGQYSGNLKTGEIVDQVKFVMARHPELVAVCSKLKVHLARIGEPSLNDNVIEAIREIRSLTDNPGLWCCLPTVVPRNRQRWFTSLTAVKNDCFPGHFQLQFSLNTTDEAVRRKMIPADLENFASVARIGEEFFTRGDRRVVLNFALATDVPFDPKVIRQFFSPEIFAVKLTPLNPTIRAGEMGLDTVLRGDGASAVEDAAMVLSESGFNVVLSIGDSRENEVGSNCGQSLRKLGL